MGLVSVSAAAYIVTQLQPIVTSHIGHFIGRLNVIGDFKGLQFAGYRFFGTFDEF
jgi:hypothetical protein